MACPPIREMLAEHGIEASVLKGELRGWTHTWLVLAGGVILDPTIKQFDMPEGDYPFEPEYIVDTLTEAWWLQSQTRRRIALVLSDQPLHGDYRALQD
jgi:hypothetical protein